MSTISAEFTLYLCVHDKDALIQAARERYLAEGGAESEFAEMIEDHGVRAALRLLLDPGRSPPGCEILDSTCEAN